MLLVGSTASRCPLALLTVMRADGWSTLSFGAEREALEDPELFSIIAGRRRTGRGDATRPATPPWPTAAWPGPTWVSAGCSAIPLLGPSGESTPSSPSWTPNPGTFSPGASGHGRHRPPRQRGAVRSPGHGQPAGPPVRAEHATSTKQTADGHSLLRSHEVAALFDVTERTVINWAASGKLACLRTVGGHLRFRSEDVMSLLEANSLRARHRLSWRRPDWGPRPPRRRAGLSPRPVAWHRPAAGPAELAGWRAWPR